MCVVFFLGIPTQILLLILKACNISAFAIIDWNNPILWIPLISFLMASVFLIVFDILDNTVEDDEKEKNV